MECNKGEALRAKAMAEQKLMEKDAVGAKKFAVKAQSLFPELDGLSQLLAVIDFLIAGEKRINGEIDYYCILSLDPSADEETMKRQYRRLAMSLHPEKNLSVGAAEAFKLLSQAWAVLSNKELRNEYDLKQGSYHRFGAHYPYSPDQNFGSPSYSGGSSSAGYRTEGDFLHVPSRPRAPAAPSSSTIGSGFPRHPSQPSSGTVAGTWYHGLSQYHGIAHQPQNPTHVACNPNYSHTRDASAATLHARFAPTAPRMRNPAPFSPARNVQRSSGPHQLKPETFWTHCNSCRVHYEYRQIYLNKMLLCPGCHVAFMAVETPAPNVNTRRSGPSPSPHQRRGVFAASTGTSKMPASTATAAATARQPSCNDLKIRHEGTGKMTVDHEVQHGVVLDKGKAVSGSNSHFSSGLKREKPVKRSRASGQSSGSSKVESDGTAGSRSEMPIKLTGFRGNSVTDKAASSSRVKPRTPEEACRSMLVAKAKTQILRHINEWTIPGSNSLIMKRPEKFTAHAEEGSSSQDQRTDQPANPKSRAEPGSSNLMNIDDDDMNPGEAVLMSVPDADFHNFDVDRVEESFSKKQVWAVYDEEDGMPRYYVVVHHIISRKPFKMEISWLNSKSSSEFGSLDWIGRGFTKTCGNFTVGKHALSKTLNSFSHPVKWKKGAKGAIQIYPDKGDVWALYRNWSPDWNELTTNETIRKYDLVLVLEDYVEDRGALVSPLIKVAGFTSVFRQHPDQGEIWAIPRQEMFRFSHQVPSYVLNRGEAPDGCYELDPAALPMELLKVVEDAKEPKEEQDAENNEGRLTRPEAATEVRPEAANAKRAHVNMEKEHEGDPEPVLTYSRKTWRRKI